MEKVSYNWKIKLSRPWTFDNDSDWFWLVVRCCHRNFKTSKCRSALALKVFLEAALIQSKRRKLSVSHLERQISLSQASKRELIDEWGCWSPRKVGRFFSVLLHELVQKCNDFVFSLYLTAGTTLMQNEMTYICFTTVQFPCCAFRWMQFILFSTRSISNKQS